MKPCIDWEEAYEAAGLWPVAVEIPSGDVFYVFWYQNRNDFSRVLVSGGRVAMLTDLEAVSRFLAGVETFGEGDPGWDAARRLARLVGSEVPEETTIPRRLLGQAIEWVRTIPAFPTAEQAEELLNCLDFLSEWHRTLRELGLVGRWPPALDGAADVLAEAVIWGTMSPLAAFERVYFLGLWPAMERVVSDVMKPVMVVRYPSAA